jgi:hypothetical protein
MSLERINSRVFLANKKKLTKKTNLYAKTANAVEDIFPLILWNIDFELGQHGKPTKHHTSRRDQGYLTIFPFMYIVKKMTTSMTTFRGP